MDFSRARYTFTFEPRFLSVLRGTLWNMSHRWRKRVVTFGLVALMIGYGVCLVFPSMDGTTAAVLSMVAIVALYWIVMAVLTVVIRWQARARYGSLPAIVRIQLTETGFDLEYPTQPVRHESFGFVNNWWLDEGRSRIVIVLGRRPVERCAIAVSMGMLDQPAWDWLLGQLRARERTSNLRRAERSFTH